MSTIAPVAEQVRDASSCSPQGNRDFSPRARLHEIFKARVLENPSKVAVSDGNTSVSYGELDARANRLAHTLRRSGLGPETRVGLLVRPGVEMIVGLLGILKAGGAYVPIDPDYPPSRISFLLQDSSVSAIATSGEASNSLEGWAGPLIPIDQNDGCDLESADQLRPTGTESADNLAYIIYTSGSTGTPKGVMVEHRSVVRLFQQTDQWFHFDHKDVWTLFHSISFDFSVWEIWGALLYGGRLVIVPDRVRRSPVTLISLLKEERVTVLNQTPSAFRQLLSAELAQQNTGGSGLRLIIFGGERLDTKLLQPWIARYGDQCPALVNMYGITETTVHVTYKRILGSDLETPYGSPIGVPIPDLQIHLLDEAQRPVRPGAAGEIYVSGPGVARGYWNLSTLTAERFITVSDVRMYRSGDRGVCSNGEFFYLGRNDGQIKVRGYRIEPGEIESSLCRHSDVSAAVVVPVDYGDGDTRVEAYIVPVAGLTLTSETIHHLTGNLTEWAKRDLPLHLRPSAYHFIPKIPMTGHGKADREALSRMRSFRAQSQGEGSPFSMTPTERAILEIAQGVLQRTGIQLMDDFFDIGATSLAFTRILLQINQKLGVKLSGQELTDVASASALAGCVDAQLRIHRTHGVA